MSILLFFIVLFILILVHEWGHFIVAKKTGMRVDEFGIGFPPKLFGIKWGETEYTFNMLPIGGFVRILGENAEAGETEADRERSFVAKSKWAQAAVLVAGVAMNIIFAWFLLVVVMTMGVATSVPEAEAGPDARLVVTDVMADSPAAMAGLPLGATITAVSQGEETAASLTPAAVTTVASGDSEEPLLITYTANGESATVSMTAVPGLIADEPERPAIGVALSLMETKRTPLFTAMYEAVKRTGALLIAITVGISSLIADSLTLDADLSDVSGPVGIVGLVGDAAEFGIASLLIFTAVISLNLAVINMLPFPALDGGRLLFVAIEAVIRRPINPAWVGALNLAGFALLILLMVAVTYSDITKLL